MGKKILIAVPCMDQVPAPFMQSIAMIQKGDNSCAIAVQMGSLVYTSRNDLGRKAIEDEYDYVMWFDSDMVFRQDTLLRMLQVMDDNNIDFLTGLYFRRQPPFTPTIFDQLDVEGEWEYTVDEETGEETKHFTTSGTVTHHNIDKVPDGLCKIAGCGFGCVLVKTDVLFDVQAAFGTMFNPFLGIGEDLAFCWRARHLGYDIWLDPSIECGHVGYSVINRSFFNAYSNAQKQKEDAENV